MKKVMKLGFMTVLLVSLLSVSSVAFADESITIEKFEQEENFVNENVGVTEKPTFIEDNDFGITPFGLDPPSSSHNLVNSGYMYFSGSAEISTLYTNKLFTGKASPRINVKNHHATQTLTIKLREKNGWFAKETYTLPPGHTLGAFPQGLSASGLYYLEFSAPSNFSGSVQ